MTKKVAPGVKCRVVGSSIGPTGSSVGRIVNVIALADPPEHVVWGPVWDCEAADGKPFNVKITSPDMQTTQIQAGRTNATFAEDWLEPLDDDPEPGMTRQAEKEITT